MSTTYEITNGEVIPYTSGRRCSDTRSWREATELEMQQLHTIKEQEQTIAKQREVIEELLNRIYPYFYNSLTEDGCECDYCMVVAAIRKAEEVLNGTD